MIRTPAVSAQRETDSALHQYVRRWTALKQRMGHDIHQVDHNM
jgi:hypothetical protein